MSCYHLEYWCKLCPKNGPQHCLSERFHVLFEMALWSWAMMAQQNNNSCKNSWKGNGRSLLRENWAKCRHLGHILSSEVRGHRVTAQLKVRGNVTFSYTENKSNEIKYQFYLRLRALPFSNCLHSVYSVILLLHMCMLICPA